MTNHTEKAIRVADITAEDIKKAIDYQGQLSTPDDGMYYRVTVFVQSEDESTPYSKDWTKEEFFECPEIKKWLKDGGAEEWTEEDLAGYDIAEIFTGSATYLKGLKDIVDDIKKDFAPDSIVTIE